MGWKWHWIYQLNVLHLSNVTCWWRHPPRVKPSCIPWCYFPRYPNPEWFQELRSTPHPQLSLTQSPTHLWVIQEWKSWAKPGSHPGSDRARPENQGFPTLPRRREWRQPILHGQEGDMFQSSRLLGAGRRACCFGKMCIIALGREQNCLQGKRNNSWHRRCNSDEQSHAPSGSSS